MRIGVLGAGPAGLYFSLLMKKADPAHEIVVVERNAPDATFGWGVVFSEETLGALRDADHESHVAITDSFARWNAIDVHYRGEVVRSGGHVFSGVARRKLLEILQTRCRELGVELSFQDEQPDISRFDGFDLVVGADGVNSTVRRLHEDRFRPTLDVHRSKFVWFGTDRIFDAFTFIFRETEHGLFQVHAYPFDAQTSTFIVECNQRTWERAGLEAVSEQESIGFCEDLFSPELAGHKLMSNRSSWISFVTVKCETWHHDNVVLLGDAAHTAHFTIGSGTKLAMEDSISLANAFLRHRSDAGRALTEYEMDRQPVVERFQEAARESATYFEDVIRYTHFEPLQFAFHLLTRSGRITHLELERRDPAFLASVDRWFTQKADAGWTMVGPRWPRQVPPRPVFGPLHLGDVTLRNRVVLDVPSRDGATDGLMDDEQGAEVEEAIDERPGLVLVEGIAVSAHGRITAGSVGLYRDDHMGPWEHRAGQGRDSTVAAVLVHAGPRGATRPRRHGVDRPMGDGGWPLFSASAIPYTPRSPVPGAVEGKQFDAIAEDFVAAARRAWRVGFGMLVLDFSHGYLLASFLSPLTNHRGDDCGGSLQNRLRFPLRVLDDVRSAWPQDQPLAVRFSASDWARGGLEPEEALEIAAAFRDQGAGLLDVVAGQTVARSRPQYGRAFLVPFSDRVRNQVRVPTMTSGNITTADQINTILAAGRADLCVLDPRMYRPAGL
jgi:anthraniloyl-CoA monooxygenase